MLQSIIMRKNIGWLEKTADGKWQIRVLFDGGDQILWRKKNRQMDHWEPFEPCAEHWQLLLEKIHSRYLHRRAPYKDLQLVERLAKPYLETP